ncbi:putative AAA family ATPase [Candidatus Magnetomoraceae bacterium gMMP-15]
MQPDSFWRDLRGFFNPSEILTGERGKKLYCEREFSPYNDMLIDFQDTIDKKKSKIAYFSGHRGSGKTSMLFHFLEKLIDDCFIIYFDMYVNSDIHRINQIDILYLIGMAVYKRAEDEGLKPNKNLIEKLEDSVFSIRYEKIEDRGKKLDVSKLIKNIICFGAKQLGANLGEQLAESVLSPFSFSSGVSEKIAKKREIEPKLQDIALYVNLIIADVQKKSSKPIIIVVDGLDKIQRLEQAKLIFIQSNALSTLRTRIIYTVPMLIYNDLNFFETESETSTSFLLPNIRLYNKFSDKEYDNGYAILKQIISKRLNLNNFSISDLFENENVVNDLIKSSGGVVRWLISLVQNSFRKAQIMKKDKVDKDVAKEAIDDLVRQITAKITRESKDELLAVRTNKTVSTTDISRELLHAQFIVAYKNGETWYDVHPILWKTLI